MMYNTAFVLAVIALCATVVSSGHPANRADDVNPRYRPLYHLAPPSGWMNDPNGFSFFRGEYHLFYQFNPNSSQVPGIAHWGHAKSKDLFHWEDLPIAMYPDKSYDKDGVFSGSAIVVNDTMVLIYTGNVNHPEQTPNHEQHQHLAFSENGIDFEKYNGNPVIAGADQQPDFRDPKIWKHEDTYYTVLGNMHENRGRALLYTSKNLYDWGDAIVLAEAGTDGSLGYNWECPDFFELDGKYILLMSPQGIEPQGDKYRNLFQTGYIVGGFNYSTLKFTPETEFKELDAGHDLYASQTMLTEDGRRVTIAWMDMWEQVYPERDDGWTGMMTVPRTLHLTSDGTVLQRPVRELEALRRQVLYSSSAEPGRSVSLESGAAELILNATGDRLGLEFEWSGNTSLTLTYESGKVTLRRGDGDDDVRSAEWRPEGSMKWRILLDRSSVELFCGEGELVFTSRFFPSAPVSVRVMNESAPVDLHVVSIERSVAVTAIPALWSILTMLLISLIRITQDA